MLYVIQQYFSKKKIKQICIIFLIHITELYVIEDELPKEYPLNPCN